MTTLHRSRRDPETNLSEQELRILAALKLNGGAVRSNAGTAVSSLYKLVYNPLKLGRSSFSNAIRELEAMGYVKRDLRNAKPRPQLKISSSSCHAIELTDKELPEIVTGVYVPELKARALREGSMKVSASKAEPSKPKVTVVTVPPAAPTKEKLAEAREQKTPIVIEPQDDGIESRIAEALYVRLEQAILAHQGDQEKIAKLSADNDRLTSALAEARRKEQLHASDRRNIELMDRTIKERDEEIERLKGQLARIAEATNNKRKGGISVSRVASLIPPEQRQELIRLAGGKDAGR